MNNTPRTDAIAHRGLGNVAYIAEMTSLGRQLERELADAREWSSRLADVADELRAELAAKDAHADEIYKAAVNLAAKLEADLTSEREQLAANHEATKLLGKWLEAERELADRLAALIKRDRDRYDGQVVGLECDCCDCEYLRPIDESLAAWKEARK